MKVLVTSGGTKVKIDMVRSITNMSHGTFGSKIAAEFLKYSEVVVTFLHANGSKLPPWRGSDRIPYPQSVKSGLGLNLVEYETFDDYAAELDLELSMQPDIIVLAAAVSDYGVANYVDGKIRSKDSMVIELKPLPKLISTVRKKCPNSVICGFKLLVNSTEDELIRAASDSLDKNRCDIVVGNDLRDIKADNHTLWMVEDATPAIHYTVYNSKTHNLPDIVVNTCFNHLEKYGK